MSIELKNLLAGLDTQQEMALYLRVGQSVLELLHDGQPGGALRKTALRAMVAQHKMDLLESPPDVVTDLPAGDDLVDA